ncbi:PREDICTED: uncharacterized protein LOC106811136 [Priapulus caudatus]|uniref:Uncharacterized protein LOC106811136 n=1 Tax=Priapulus caudatus TaxID=37621 RepID=A0ABM1ED93_PRICU|nr:PREDICTED: uncharacterized protein LOC106811136 [Priapulus caudatus]
MLLCTKYYNDKLHGFITTKGYRLKERFEKATRIVNESDAIIDEILRKEMMSEAAIGRWLDEWRETSAMQKKQALLLSADEAYAECLQRAKVERCHLDVLDGAERAVHMEKIKR